MTGVPDGSGVSVGSELLSSSAGAALLLQTARTVGLDRALSEQLSTAGGNLA
jgi:hypothetical protein